MMFWTHQLHTTAGNSNDKSQDKNDKFLLPFTLTTDHVPSDLRAWKEEFFKFYDSSGMSKYPLSKQQAYFFKCIEPEFVKA